MSTPSPRIEVRIDELVLHGFDARHRRGIADAVAAELATALQGWAPSAAARVTRLDGGSVSLPPAALPAAVGRQVGRRIGDRLREQGRPSSPGAAAGSAGSPGGSA